MGKMGKTFAVLLALIVFVSCLTMLIVEPAIAQTSSPLPSIPTPSVPQFTIKLADHSYNVPEKTRSYTDPYTGKIITETHPAYYVKNLTIDLNIKNQPTPSISGYQPFISYQIEFKGSYGKDWWDVTNSQLILENDPIQSNSDYTLVSIRQTAFSPGDHIDFRIRAVSQYKYTDFIGSFGLPQEGTKFEVSYWRVQTVILPENNSNVNPTPSVPESNSFCTRVFLVNNPTHTTHYTNRTSNS